MSEKEKKGALLGIFIVILSDITGFGMIIPLAPILAREFGAEGLKVGLLISCYSAVQFAAAPFWGRLSDLFGRKPIILCGLLGSAASHLFFAYSDSLGDLFASRLMAGFFGGNIVIASAYIADRTSRQKRSKNLALIGMAFGLGFTIGPLLGFLFIILGGKLGSQPPYGANFAAMGSVLVCLLNFILAGFFLKESFFPEKQKDKEESLKASAFLTACQTNSKNPFLLILKFFNVFAVFRFFKQFFRGGFFKSLKSSSLFSRPSFYMIWTALQTPRLGLVLIMSFILWLSLAQIEPVLILLVQDGFGWSKKTAYGSFIYIGLLMVLSQGWLVRRWIPKWGEKLINQAGLLIMSLGLLAIAAAAQAAAPSGSFFSLAFWILLFGVTFFSIGYSLSSASLNGALSLLSSSREQGSIFGVNQSLSAAARISGPIIGGALYQSFSYESPFIAAGLFSFAAFILAFQFKKDFPNEGRERRPGKPAAPEA